MPLSDLITALAAATGPSRELDAEIAVAVFGFQYAGHGYLRAPSGMFHYHRDIPAFTASLDAITGAVREKWPDVGWDVQSGGQAWIGRLSAPARYSVTARSPAIALGLAAARLAAAEE